MGKRIYNQTALFGELYAYLAVISPPEHVMLSVARIKQEMNAIAPISNFNLRSKPHITLFERLSDDISLPETTAALLARQKPFKVTVSGTGTFEHPSGQMIYFKIQNPEPIAELGKALRTSVSPYLTLARRLDAIAVEKLKPYLDSLGFEAEWLCTDVVLLRKLMSEKQKGFREKFPIALNG